MTSPLTPVPQQWPATLSNLEVHETGLITLPEGIEIYIEKADRPGICAALLAGSTARVIDLGELPEAERVDELGGGFLASGVVIYDSVDDDSEIVKSLRGELAILEARGEARAAKPARDPAEVEAITSILRDIFITPAPVGQVADRILDALATVRGTR